MSRQSLLACAWLSIAFGLAVVAAPTAARSQDASTQERLDRLERDLNMLQRQVYRGAPPSGGGGVAVDSAIRMDRLEAQMRELTHFLSLGAAGVIPKPFDPMTLADAVR